MTHILDDLTWRGLIATSTDLDAMRARLDAGPVTYYCGFDPTGASLHVGHLVQVLTLRRIQQAGNNPIALVGGATGQIGDPKMTGERTLNAPDVVAGWAERLRHQIEPFLDFGGTYAARMVNNLEWTAGMSTIEFLRDVGKHYRLGTMLAKETVARRLNSEQGISFTEFAYQILQGLDFRELYRRYGCELQTGGNDQWGNLLSGVELIRRSDGHTAHAMATPLVTKADGTKFGKTEGGGVWLDPQMTSPYDFYQFFLNSSDEDVIGYLKMMSSVDREGIEQLELDTAERPHLRAAQRRLAQDLTSLVHGSDACHRVERAAAALFGSDDLRDLDESTLGAAVAQLPHATLAGESAGVVELMDASGIVPSRSAARRAIAEGGAYLNNVKIADADACVGRPDLLHGRWAILRRGRKTLAVVEAPAVPQEGATRPEVARFDPSARPA